MYRLCIKEGRKWRTGLKSYPTIEAASERVEQLLRVGVHKENVKIVSENNIMGGK